MMAQRPAVEMVLRLDVAINSFRFVGKTPEFQVGCTATCTTGGGTDLRVDWVVYKSFEECQVFDTRMRSGHLSPCMTSIPFAPLHKTKTFFGQSNKPSFLATRQRDLQEYLDRVTRIPGITNFQGPDGSPALADFFSVHGHVVLSRGGPAPAAAAVPMQTPNGYNARRLSNSSELLSMSYESEPAQQAPPTSLATPVDDDDDDMPTRTHAPPTSLGTPRSSDESDETHLTEAQQQELQELIFQRITDAAGADTLKAFQKRARRFGKATDAVDVEGAAFYHFMVESFGTAFCQWLVPSLAALLPDRQKRLALTAAMTLETSKTPLSSSPYARPTGRSRPASEMAIPSARNTRPAGRSRPQSLNAKDVLAKVRDLVDGDEARVDEFRHRTKELRAYRTSAAEYSEYIVATFGTDVSKDVLASVATAMSDNQIQEELQMASEHVHSLRGSIQRQRMARRKSMDRNSSFSRKSSVGSLSIEEEDVDVHPPPTSSSDEDVPAQPASKILSRLRNQGAVNLMSFTK
ncbi:Aste57867_1441 [Aphanomyces stellatus]|uniref:Aste57867_1441 protein n=1 Tax=Aphanomyces stellatus TaxID=120398 RepID=A0A485K8K2_9STRA|nr:hypothetical protein As57867_001440 [Aphanomyces stellatus]VFT78658.1 Aste57867_1441 [Aphanomyces stellatus]